MTDVVRFVCPFCGADDRCVPSVPLICCNVRYVTFDDLPNPDRPEIIKQVLELQREAEQPGVVMVALHGPGAELKKLFTSLGISKTKDCGCAAMIAQMNVWGVVGCRLPENRLVILDHLQKHYGASSVLTKAKAGAIAWWTETPMTLEGLLDLAIERAEAMASPALGS